MPIKSLERVFSKAGLGSRTEARSAIHAGRVRVNGTVIQNPDHWVDLERDKITLDGKRLQSAARAYLLLYKPKGYLTTHRDPEGRPTVYDLIGDAGQWVTPVGRLDLDTSGLLILTNDTAFSDRIMSPEYKVPKTYEAKASTRLSDEQLDRLRNGVELSGGPTRPAQVRRLRDVGKYTHLEITITEGRNRQVRRMLEAVGRKVLALTRMRVGKLELDDLQVGQLRRIRPSDVL